jgi:hypothetical protein
MEKWQMEGEVKSTAAVDLILAGDMEACMASCIFISMTTPHTIWSHTKADDKDEVAWQRRGEGKATTTANLMLARDMEACTTTCIFISMTVPGTAAELTEANGGAEAAWHGGGEAITANIADLMLLGIG